MIRNHRELSRTLCDQELFPIHLYTILHFVQLRHPHWSHRFDLVMALIIFGYGLHHTSPVTRERNKEQAVFWDAHFISGL